MSKTELQKIVRDAESLELNDLIKIREVLEDAVAKHRDYDDVIIMRQGAPYYT